MSEEPEVLEQEIEDGEAVSEEEPVVEEQGVASESLQPDDLAEELAEDGDASDGVEERDEDLAVETADAGEAEGATAEESGPELVEVNSADAQAAGGEAVDAGEELPEVAPDVQESAAEEADELDDAVEEEPPRQEGRHWYVIHSYSGYENKVKKNLESRIESMGMEDYIFEVVVPTEDVVELRDGRRRTVEQRIFPGYILVDMILTDESWFVVRNTPSVTGFVGSGNQPTPLRDDEASGILRRMEEEAPKVKVSFRIGDAVRIIDGPFTDFMGTVDDLNLERGKVRLLVSFFGRETPVELDFLQVETQ
jgi:transcriptional antiterminator NusG